VELLRLLLVLVWPRTTIRGPLRSRGGGALDEDFDEHNDRRRRPGERLPAGNVAAVSVVLSRALGGGEGGGDAAAAAADDDEVVIV
jgi:hypothetical protein